MVNLHCVVAGTLPSCRTTPHPLGHAPTLEALANGSASHVHHVTRLEHVHQVQLLPRLIAAGVLDLQCGASKRVARDVARVQAAAKAPHQLLLIDTLGSSRPAWTTP